MSNVTNRRASGYWQSTGLAGEVRDGETLSCEHCQRTWVVRKGSGKVRGFCTRCMGYTCGNPACEACVPAERRAENVEAGRPPLEPPPAKILTPDDPAFWGR